MAAAGPEEERVEFGAAMEATQREQGIATMRERWPGTSLPRGRISYVITIRDTLIDPDLQRSMAESLDAETYEIDAGHEVFIERPAELGVILVDLADRTPPHRPR